MMRKHDQANANDKAKWVLGAMGLVLAYFGAFALLMYPVVNAAGTIA
jgi:hypothetical protein